MDCLAQKSEIKNTFTSVREFSFSEKKSPFMDQDKMNAFLDAINDFKKSLTEKSEKIFSLNDQVDKITWFNELDEECLKLINDLILAIKDLRSSLVRQYVSMSFLRQKGVAKEEIKTFVTNQSSLI